MFSCVVRAFDVTVLLCMYTFTALDQFLAKNPDRVSNEVVGEISKFQIDNCAMK